MDSLRIASVLVYWTPIRHLDSTQTGLPTFKAGIPAKKGPMKVQAESNWMGGGGVKTSPASWPKEYEVVLLLR